MITAYFPCPSPEEIAAIHEETLSISAWFKFGDAGVHILRGYLGEEVAFYFRFVAHVRNAVLALGIIVLAFGFAGGVFGENCLSKRKPFNRGHFAFLLAAARHVDILQDEQEGTTRTVIAMVVSIWAATMLQVFARHTSRVRQVWGVPAEEEFLWKMHSKV